MRVREREREREREGEGEIERDRRERGKEKIIINYRNYYYQNYFRFQIQKNGKK